MLPDVHCRRFVQAAEEADVRTGAPCCCPRGSMVPSCRTKVVVLLVRFYVARGILEAEAPTGGLATAERVESARLFGNINQYAYYFTDLMVGSPKPQRVSVIVDTGSSLCGFPCSNCEHCGRHIDPPFDIDLSKSAKWIACNDRCEGSCKKGLCGYSQSYTEGSSISGIWFQDLVRLGDKLQHNPAVNATLGCHLDERNLFYTQRVNGIMGIAPHQNSGRPTILQDLFGDKQHVNTGIFSICLAEWGGLLTVGGYSPENHVNGTQVQWIPLVHSGYYSVTPIALELGGVPLVSGRENFGTSLVDSGTTFTYFPTQVFNRLTASLIAACTSGSGCGAHRESNDCWRLDNDADDPAKFPPLTIVFEGGARVEWTPRGYLFQRGEPSLWCHAFAENGGDSDTVLGVSWMLHKDVIFDLPGSRLGVVEARCPEYREAPGEELSLGWPVNARSQRPVVLVALLIMGIGASLLVAVGLCLWLLIGSCQNGWSMVHPDDEEQGADQSSARGVYC